MKTKILTLTMGLVFIPGFANKNQSPSLDKINQTQRALYAQRVLGSNEFNRLAKERNFDAALEYFVLKKVESAFSKRSPLSINKIANAIITESNRFELDPIFVIALIEQESSFNPETLGSHGEIGLMQIMPKTAFWIAQKHHIKFTKKKQLLDPIVNIRIGVRYLAWLNQKFEDTRHSTAAYNMGPKNVKKILAKNKQPAVYFDQVLIRYKRLYAEVQLTPPPNKDLSAFLLAGE